MEFKHCPFCGATGEDVELVESKPTCKACGSQAETLEMWNTRAEPLDRDEVYLDDLPLVTLYGRAIQEANRSGVVDASEVERVLASVIFANKDRFGYLMQENNDE